MVVAATLAPGALIAGRYRIEARLGAGGGGTVWRCLDEQLGAIVALKVVGADVDIERWRREVAMARRIADRNVCRVHDLGETAELRFVTMELVEGASLRSRLRAGLPVAEARALFTQIVSGVAAIHAAGVVHRDLKPENIVVANDGRAVIVDFGLAREPRPPGLPAGAATPPAPSPSTEAVTIAGGGPTTRSAPPRSPERASGATVTHAGVVVGTPRYMSPEQASGETVDARTDVWALGLIGHELYAGTLPGGEPDCRTVDPVIEERAPALAPILRRCLEFAPEARFADARALAAALDGNRRPRRWWPWVIGAVVATGASVTAALVWTRPSAEAPAGSPLRLLQVTTTDPRQWPASSPVSVAFSPDGARFAYTTGDGRLWVRDLAGGAPLAWATPKQDDRTDRPRDLLVSSWAAGWFSDRSIALVGTTPQGEWELFRIYPDGRSQLLHRHPSRFVVAVDPNDRIAIAIDDYAVFVLPPGEHVAPEQLTALGRGDVVTGLAWSPDGTKLAVGITPAAPATSSLVRVMSDRGAEPRDVWSGAPAAPEQAMLAWLDGARLALTTIDPATHATALVAVDVATTTATTRAIVGDELVAAGSAARGTLLLLRGTARPSVQVGDRWGEKFQLVHDPALVADHVAGWTPAGELVFAAGSPGAVQLVKARPGQPPVAWPGTRPGGETPDTVVGDDVIVHHTDATTAQRVIERLGPTGARVELARTAATTGEVRCAGDRAPPCVIEQVAGNVVQWTELDPTTGALGAVILQRQLHERGSRSAALSPDGAQLAVVEGGPGVVVVARAGGTPEKSPSAGDGAALHALGFGPDGELWASATGHRGRRFGLMTFKRRTDDKDPTNGHFMSAFSRGARTDTLRWYGRPAPSPDGQHVAVEVRELHLEIWRADGL